MTKLFVNYSERCLGGGEVCEGEDPNYRFACHEPTYMEFTVDSVTLNHITAYHEEFSMDSYIPSEVWVVTVIYSDGNTFGHTEGYGRIEAVVRTEGEADIIASKIRKGDYTSRSGYNSWGGYFASLTDVRVERFKVRES